MAHHEQYVQASACAALVQQAPAINNEYITSTQQHESGSEFDDQDPEPLPLHVSNDFETTTAAPLPIMTDELDPESTRKNSWTQHDKTPNGVQRIWMDMAGTLDDLLEPRPIGDMFSLPSSSASQASYSSQSSKTSVKSPSRPSPPVTSSSRNGRRRYIDKSNNVSQDPSLEALLEPRRIEQMVSTPQVGMNNAAANANVNVGLPWFEHWPS